MTVLTAPVFFNLKKKKLIILFSYLDVNMFLHNLYEKGKEKRYEKNILYCGFVALKRATWV